MFRDLIFEKSGINLHEGKKELLRTRLGSRIRKRELSSFKEYFQFVERDKSNNELMELLDAISTNLTSFFREDNHFQFLKEQTVPELMVRNRTNKKDVVRGWSAGCSSGEEPYTIAITLLENSDLANSWQIKLLATDISLEMLEKANRGAYSQDRVEKVPKNLVRKHFIKDHDNNNVSYQVKSEVRKLISFRRLNLMTPRFPFKHQFDFIFCRNVMIYFDKPTQKALVSKFYDSMVKGGYLFIGHSESLTGIEHQFKYVLPTIYKK